MDLGSYDAEAARERIAAIAHPTPLIFSPWLSDHIDREVFLKLECLQVTGSFKLRGAANKILTLDVAQRRRGVIACSSGNHGLATAYVAARERIPATICLPEWVDPTKLAAIRETGAEAVVEGATAEESEQVSLRLQRQRGLTTVHPFDDPDVIAGQGTIGHEILEQTPNVGTILVPASGGGLICGIAVGVRRLAPHVRVVGAYASRAPALAKSVVASRLIAVPEVPTIANALAGNLGPVNRHSLRLASELVDSWIAVREEQILDAMRFAYRRHRLVVEGGGAVGIGALRSGWVVDVPGSVVVVVSGGNIDLAKLSEILASTTAC